MESLSDWNNIDFPIILAQASNSTTSIEAADEVYSSPELEPRMPYVDDYDYTFHYYGYAGVEATVVFLFSLLFGTGTLATFTKHIQPAENSDFYLPLLLSAQLTWTPLVFSSL